MNLFALVKAKTTTFLIIFKIVDLIAAFHLTNRNCDAKIVCVDCTERCPSGLRSRSWKPVTRKSQGFESLPLRQTRRTPSRVFFLFHRIGVWEILHSAGMHKVLRAVTAIRTHLAQNRGSESLPLRHFFFDNPIGFNRLLTTPDFATYGVVLKLVTRRPC